MRTACFMISLALASPVAAQTLTVVTLDRTRQPERVLTLAQDEASRLFAEAGVHIVWTPTVPAGSFVRLVIDTAPSFRERPMPDGAMGLAVEPTVAYAFTGDADQIARTHRIPAATVLGMVIAHELTHLMLSQAHASTGLMKARWTAADFVAASNRAFRLDADTAAKLRAAVMARRPPDPQSPIPASSAGSRR